MKFLISATFSAIRTGSFVTASEASQEFILNTDCDEKDIPAKATLMEIAKANKVSLKDEKKSVMLENLATGLSLLKLPEQNQMSDQDKIKEIIVAGIEAEKTDEEMLVEIVMAGVKYKAAGRMFKQLMEEGGYRISNKARTEEIVAILEEAEFAPETYEEFAAMISRITDGVEAFVAEDEDGEEVEVEAVVPVADTTELQARKVIKKYAKDNDIELPKIPAKPKGGLRTRFFDHVIANPAITLEELKVWLAANTKDEEAVENFMKKFQPLLEFAQSVANAGSETEG